jgi:polyhydroxybutyrate depolymerase
MNKRVVYFVLWTAVLLLFSSCGGGSGGSSDGASPDGSSGTLSIAVTDARPVIPGNPSEVWITFEEVLAHGPGGDWVSLPLPQSPLRINVLAFANGQTTDLVPPVELDSGEYTQLRLVVSTAEMLINGVATPIDLDVPSGFLRIDKNLTFDVPRDAAVDLTLDFDLSQSIVATGSSEYRLKPVLHLVRTQQAAAIQGVIPPDAFGGSAAATLTLWRNKDSNCNLDATVDEVYTKVDVPKGDPARFKIHWLEPREAYIVQVDAGGKTFVLAVPGPSATGGCQELPPGAVYDLEPAAIEGKVAEAAFAASSQALVTVIRDRDSTGTLTAGDETYAEVEVPKGAAAAFSISVFPGESYIVQVKVGGTTQYQTAVAAAKLPVGAVFRVNGGAPIGGDGPGDDGDPGGDPGPGNFTREIQFDGLRRGFNVHVPARYTGAAPVPLVLDFHGLTSSATAQAGLSGFVELSETEGFIVVHPEGYQNSWNGGNCCGQAQSAGLDDVGLAVAIVDHVAAQWNVDPGRVYATGLSNGGALTHRIGCEAADVFAAIAPVSFPLGVVPLSACKPSQPISVIYFHGLGDTLVPYDGGIFASAEESFAYWAQVNGCTGTAEVTLQTGESRCVTFTRCTGGVEVTLCSLDGGHVLYWNQDVDIARRAWEVFSRFSLP